MLDPKEGSPNAAQALPVITHLRQLSNCLSLHCDAPDEDDSEGDDGSTGRASADDAASESDDGAAIPAAGGASRKLHRLRKTAAAGEASKSKSACDKSAVIAKDEDPDSAECLLRDSGKLQQLVLLLRLFRRDGLRVLIFSQVQCV
jgi:hypothetical protein